MVLHALKYYSIRIWITASVGGFLCLWFMPMFQATLGAETTLPIVAIICTGVYLLFNFTAGRLTAFFTTSLINEASSWERSGFLNEAEKAYQKAAALFDSFLFSPIGYKKRCASLLRRMSRFYLAKAEKDALTDIFLIDYFKNYPEDEEALQIWIRQLIGKAPLEKEYHAVTSLIGEIHAGNQSILNLLAHLFISCHRTDFIALQTYQRYLEQSRGHNNNFIRKLARIFINEGRADERALEIYLKAIAIDKNNQKLLNGLAACVSWMQINQTNRHLLDLAQKYLTGMDESTLSRMRRGFHLPAARSPVVSTKKLRRLFTGIRFQLIQMVKTVAAQTQLGLIQLHNIFLGCRQWAQSSSTLKWLILVVFGIISGLFIFNTLTHIERNEKPAHSAIVLKPPPKKTASPQPANGPFTLQVAAYLKREHALNYVQQLQEHQIDAYYIETRGVSNTWYQVRLSSFADKKTARNYGNKLKSSGIIDDFFVAKYSRK